MSVTATRIVSSTSSIRRNSTGKSQFYLRDLSKVTNTFDTIYTCWNNLIMLDFFFDKHLNQKILCLTFDLICIIVFYA